MDPEPRQVRRQRRLRIEAAFVEELHQCHCRERLSDGADRKQGLRSCRRFRLDVGMAVRDDAERPVSIGDRNDERRDDVSRGGVDHPQDVGHAIRSRILLRHDVRTKHRETCEGNARNSASHRGSIAGASTYGGSAVPATWAVSGRPRSSRPFRAAYARPAPFRDRRASRPAQGRASRRPARTA